MEENVIQTEETKAPEIQEEACKPKSRTFTQDEVNKIIADRLAREKEKSSVAAAEQYTAKLNELETMKSKLECKEFLMDNDYPMEMLEVMNTSDVEQFKANASKLFDTIARGTKRTVSAPAFNADNGGGGEFAKAFSHGEKHEPKKKMIRRW